MYEMMVSYSIYIIVVGLVCSHDWKWCPRGPPLASAARDRNAHSTHLLICPSWTWKWPLCCAPLQRPGYLWLSLWVYVVSTMWYKFCPFLRGNIVFYRSCAGGTGGGPPGIPAQLCFLSDPCNYWNPVYMFTVVLFIYINSLTNSLRLVYIV